MAGTRIAIATVAVVTMLVASCTVPAPAPVSTDPPPGATGPSAGCGSTVQAGVTDARRTVRVGDSSRVVTITIPSSHVVGTDTPIPLVLAFHGLFEGAAGTHPVATQLSALADAEGFAVAYPLGSNSGVNWDVSLSESNRDLVFVDALLATLGEELCLDRSRIYITGLSYGAFMTSMLMCMRSNTFAAAAPVAGIQNRCTATERSMPFLSFHGTADTILPYDGFTDTPSSIAAKYGCDSAPQITTLTPNPDPVTRGAITHSVWDCSQVDAAAEFYTIERGGHSWPGSQFFSLIRPIVGPTASSLDATAVIWDFFARHQL